jgi:hypothetical protein
MNYFCSLFNYANFSNIFSLCQKPYQKKHYPSRQSSIDSDFLRPGLLGIDQAQHIQSCRQTIGRNAIFRISLLYDLLIFQAFESLKLRRKSNEFCD